MKRPQHEMKSGKVQQDCLAKKCREKLFSRPFTYIFQSLIVSNGMLLGTLQELSLILKSIYTLLDGFNFLQH